MGAAEKKIDSADLRKISRLKGEHLGLDRIKEMDLEMREEKGEDLKVQQGRNTKNCNRQ